MQNLIRLLKEQKGSEQIAWAIMMLIVLFLFFTGALYIQRDREKSGAMFAASAGARAYGIALENPAQNATAAAGNIVLNALIAEGLLPQGTTLLPQGSYPAQGVRGASIYFIDNGEGEDISCTVTYFMPQPLPHVNKLLRLPNASFYSFTVTGMSKHEYSS